MDYVGCPVVSLAGRDKGFYFCVIGADGEHLLLADGRHRRIDNPKRKKLKHLLFIDAAAYSGPLTNKAVWAYLRDIRNSNGQVST
ncbi:MAG: KOW domain-containing RNA-binding protein [Clostridia bacterium]|nr:KOW domain-containing RNA-binding protein [Clostridia bacterium]